jgi:hypothetical protein
MVARFTSPCAAGCGHAIEPGQWMLYANRVSRHVECPSGVPAAAAVQRPEPLRIAVEDKGVYILDGSIVQVVVTRDGKRTYALRWVDKGGQRVTEAGTFVNGEYEYERGLVAQVAERGRKMTKDEAKRFILRYGVCCRCHRTLKAAKSVERALEDGLGPVCRTYFDRAA